MMKMCPWSKIEMRKEMSRNHWRMLVWMIMKVNR